MVLGDTSINTVASVSIPQYICCGMCACELQWRKRITDCFHFAESVL